MWLINAERQCLNNMLPTFSISFDPDVLALSTDLASGSIQFMKSLFHREKSWQSGIVDVLKRASGVFTTLLL